MLNHADSLTRAHTGGVQTRQTQRDKCGGRFVPDQVIPATALQRPAASRAVELEALGAAVGWSNPSARLPARARFSGPGIAILRTVDGVWRDAVVSGRRLALVASPRQTK